MIDSILRSIYTANLLTVFIAIPIFILAWSVMGSALYKHMRIISVIATLIAIGAILYVTVFSRDERVVGAVFKPFTSFERAKLQPEMYRSMLMNVFLFVPLGLSLPFVFGGSTGKRILLTILVGLLLSVTIEAIQYFAQLGMAETDDVICNTLGTAIGSCAMWRKILNKKGKENA